MKKFGFLLVILIFIGGNAWGSNTSLLSLASSYKRVVKKYTKEKAVYSVSDLDVKYRWFATYHSPEFLEAVQEQFAKLYPNGAGKYPEEQKSKMQSPNQSTFMISLYARKSGLKKMVGNKNLWEIDLVVDGEAMKPVSVEGIRVTPFQTKFYPYLQEWYTVYRVVFPVDLVEQKPAQVFLQLSGVDGVSKVIFKKL